MLVMLCGLPTGQQKENWMANENMLLPILAEAVKLPGVRINRGEFLQKTLEKYCSQAEISYR